MENLNLYTFETDTIKEINEMPVNYNWSNDYNKINIKEELKIISREFIKTQLIIKDDKLYIAGEKIDIRISKNGFVYFLLNDNVINGLLRSECLNLLFNKYRTNEVTKGGKYEFISLIKNGRKMVAWFNIKTQTVEFISTTNKANEVIESVAFWSFKDEPDSKPMYLRTNESYNEIYGYTESSLGSIYTDDLINRLEITKEIIEEAISSTNNDVKELIKEIKDMLDGY